MLTNVRIQNHLQDARSTIIVIVIIVQVDSIASRIPTGRFEGEGTWVRCSLYQGFESSVRGPTRVALIILILRMIVDMGD